MNLGECLQKARKQRGFSQQQLADELGVSRQTISKWELNETQPELSQARKLAEALHLSLDELTHYDPQLREIEQVIEKTSEKKQNEIKRLKEELNQMIAQQNFEEAAKLRDQIRAMESEGEQHA